ncbi:hypothetical protein V6N13_088472 [Hibiscus sabdariffa]|uniref:RNase H type-1 domain-containing protein n=1 Tax=Hibiscus sabdariffa TaxID=183260 RepID=A0ABR2FZV9_9ROSI
MQVLVRNKFTFLIVLLRSSWNRRNKAAQGENQLNSRQGLEEAREIYAHFKNCMLDPSQYPPPRLVGWRKPPSSIIKIHVDGGICRGYKGRCNWDHCSRSPHDGVAFAVANGWNVVMIEGDAISIVNRLLKSKLDFSVTSCRLQDTQLLLAQNRNLEFAM